MTHSLRLSDINAMPLAFSVLGLAFALAAATALGPMMNPAPTPGMTLSVTDEPSSPFASGAALRNLLF